MRCRRLAAPSDASARVQAEGRAGRATAGARVAGASAGDEAVAVGTAAVRACCQSLQ